MNKCDRCQYEFKSSYMLNKHKNRKVACKKVTLSVNDTDKQNSISSNNITSPSIALSPSNTQQEEIPDWAEPCSVNSSSDNTYPRMNFDYVTKDFVKELAKLPVENHSKNAGVISRIHEENTKNPNPTHEEECEMLARICEPDWDGVTHYNPRIGNVNTLKNKLEAVFENMPLDELLNMINPESADAILKLHNVTMIQTRGAPLQRSNKKPSDK